MKFEEKIGVDARIESSLKRIKGAYLEEKRKKSIVEIKVIDICKKAGVNKTTFYRHYRDIYDLADGIENETIAEIVREMKHVDDLLTDPEKFVKDSMDVFARKVDLTKLVFDTRYEILIHKVEKELIAHYLQGNHTERETLLIQFCVGGASHIMTGNLTKEESEKIQKFLIQMIKKMIR